MGDILTSEPGRTTIIRDIKLIERYARNNEAEDLRFRNFVVRDLDMSTSALDEKVAATTDEVRKQLDCLACGRCCRFLQVVVDDKDIKRLAHRLGILPREVLHKYVNTAPDGTSHLNSIPCPFLLQDNRCSVYEDRPQSCRDFPYLHAGATRSRLLTLLEYISLCPIIFNVWDQMKRELWKHGRRKSPGRSTKNKNG